MKAAELARLVQTWSDALTIAEVMATPFLRVGKEWDFHDWQSVEISEGLEFRQFQDGQTTATVTVLPPESAAEAALQVFVAEEGSSTEFRATQRRQSLQTA